MRAAGRPLVCRRALTRKGALMKKLLILVVLVALGALVAKKVREA